jgi:hypothetical protein
VFSKKLMTSLLVSAIALLLIGADRAYAEEPNAPIPFVVIGAPTGDKDTESVISALQKLLHGLEQRDLTVITECLSPRVVMIDDRSSNVVFGREPVLEHIKTYVIGNKSASPVRNITVYNPFVRVKDDTAMVSFRAVKTMADAPSTKLESLCSEVFERRDGNWYVLQFRSKWQPLAAKE